MRILKIPNIEKNSFIKQSIYIFEKYICVFKVLNNSINYIKIYSHLTLYLFFYIRVKLYII